MLKIKHKLDTSYMPPYIKVQLTLEGDGMVSSMIDVMKPDEAQRLLRSIKGLQGDLEAMLNMKEEKSM